jgi:hypothetical protein
MSADIADVLTAFVWPAVVLILLLVYRRHLIGLMDRILPRVAKVSFGAFSLELAKAQEATVTFSDAGMDFRHGGVAAQVQDSTTAQFRAQLQDTTPADFAVIDLGSGKEWLTSRLFIMAILLKRVRGVRAFVFLESTNGRRRSFVGAADSESIRWRLSMRYPWLEDAFRRAYATVPVAIVTSQKGGLDPMTAVDVLREFLRQIQNPVVAPNPPIPATPTSPPIVFPPPVFSPDEGIPLNDPAQTRERAEWLDGGKLESILGDSLVAAHVTRSELRGKSEAAQMNLLLAEAAAFIAVTRQDMRFEYLIERQRLVERVAESSQLRAAANDSN